MSERMEPIMDDFVGKAGKNTCVVRIPADTAKVMGIKPGSRVIMHKEGNRLILEFPVEGVSPKIEAPGPETF